LEEIAIRITRQPGIRQFICLIEKTENSMNVLVAIGLLTEAVFKAVLEKSCGIFKISASEAFPLRGCYYRCPKAVGS